jgi:hypothetical protein
MISRLRPRSKSGFGGIESTRVTALLLLVVLCCNYLSVIHSAKADPVSFRVSFSYVLSNNWTLYDGFRIGVASGKLFLAEDGFYRSKSSSFVSTSIPQAGGRGCARANDSANSKQQFFDVTRLSDDSWRIRSQRRNIGTGGTAWFDSTFEFQATGKTCEASLLSTSLQNSHGVSTTLVSVRRVSCFEF